MLDTELMYELEDEYVDDAEGDYEDDYEFEEEYEYEDDYEYAGEYEYDLADILAGVASRTSSEMEAEAMVAAAAGKILPAKSAAVRKVAPNLIEGTRKLTKVIHRTDPRITPVVNTILRRTGKVLAKQRKVTPSKAAEVMALETKKVLSSPTTCAKAIVKSAKKTGKITKRLSKKRRMPVMR